MVPVEKLIHIVGAGKVAYEQATLQEYSKDLSFVKAITPAYVIKPKSGEEIKKIVDLANETRTPLVPVSSGPPHFRGDTVPGIDGAVVVDLSGMKKIIRIDRPNRVAMVEPGVTFGELMPELQKEGLRLNVPLLPRKSKSVLGSMLEREPVIMPKYHWDIADPLACVEVVFGTGDIFRTGAAAGPGSIEEQWAAGGAQKEAAGPLQASWYRIIQGSQGTVGIVTWASMRCELLPHLEEPFLVGSTNLGTILELIHWLIRLRLVNECLVVNNTNLAAILAKTWPNDYQDIKESLPPWVLFFNVAGYEYLPEERVNSQVQDMFDITQRMGMEPVQAINGVTAHELLAAVHQPSDEPYWKLRSKGTCHDIFFLTRYDNLQDLIGIMNDAAHTCGYSSSDMGVYLQPIVQGTNCHCEFNLFYNPENESEVNQVKDLSMRVVNDLIAHGAFFSRPYGESAGMIMNRNTASATALRKVKDILDPKHIMNPGKLCF